MKTEEQFVASQHIKVKTDFVAFHRYKMAPLEVAFLRTWHRHKFYVTASLPVRHGNRDIEFFMIKAVMDKFIKAKFEGKSFEASCEMVAADIAFHLSKKYMLPVTVEVSEDGENSGLTSVAFRRRR